MRRRGGSYSRGVALDDRTGHKVYGRKLRQDGETGVLTTDYDGPHPQRFQRSPGPDGTGWRPGRSADDPRGDEWIMKTGSWSPITGQHSQRPMLRFVLGERGHPLIVGGDGFSVGAAINIAINELTFDTDNSKLLLEGGDELLLEDGDEILLG